MTTERNVTSSSRNAIVSTKPKTSGRWSFIESLKSLLPAASPLTLTVVPGTCWIVAGTTSSRSAASDFSRRVVSLRIGMWTTASVLAGLTCTSIGSYICPVRTAAARSRAMPARTGGDVTSDACTTTSAGSVVPGKAAWTRS